MLITLKSMLRVALYSFALLLAPQLALAAPVTFNVSTANPPTDNVAYINLNTLLPLSTRNVWAYTYDQGSFPSRNVNAVVGGEEKIGGGCLSLRPLILGDDVILYIGNYGDKISLHGIYLRQWKDLEDVLLKFETRYRVEWLDFQNRFVSESITPISDISCQDTGRGAVERGGAVLLEDLTRQLGVAGSGLGEIDCSSKNTDLRDNFLNGGSTGSGTAHVRGQLKSLSWRIDSIALTRNSGNGVVNIQMDFNPTIQASDTDYSMHFDMTLTPGVGVTHLRLTDDGSTTLDDIHDVQFTYNSSASSIRVRSNEVRPGGSCGGDGRLSFLVILLLLGFAPLRALGKQF